MKISIIIATLHRYEDLKVLFESLLLQTKRPFEIIIIDQSDDDKTKRLCQTYEGELPLKYFYCSVKSASYCRNYGVEKSRGDVIAFLDDDTKLLPDYLECVESFYHEHPNALGGMSKIINYKEFRERLLGQGSLHFLYKIVATFFGLNTFKKGFIILKSSRNIDYYESEHPIKVEWLSTCNSWLKKSVFNEFRFEDKFQKWSFGEDRMLSYQIFKKYPGSLYFYPNAALYHYESKKNRLPEANKILMKVIYQFWFSHKCIKRNHFFYWWGNMGEIVLHFLNACIKREPFINSWHYLKANLRLIFNLDSIKAGNLEGILD